MIIVLNEPDIANIIQTLFSQLNPDTPFTPDTLNKTQRIAIGAYLMRGLDPFNVNSDTDDLVDDLVCELEHGDDAVLELLDNILDRMSLRNFIHQLISGLTHITVGEAATTLLLHFRHREGS
jgi:hypothetical protein